MRLLHTLRFRPASSVHSLHWQSGAELSVTYAQLSDVGVYIVIL